MANILRYDTEAMRSQAGKLREASEAIETAVGDMLKYVETLRSEWVGDGATALLDKLGTGWQTPILSYAGMLGELATRLETAADAYDGLGSEYARIQAP